MKYKSIRKGIAAPHVKSHFLLPDTKLASSIHTHGYFEMTKSNRKHYYFNKRIGYSFAGLIQKCYNLKGLEFGEIIRIK